MKTSNFSGKSKDWSKWSKTFLAKASLRGYKALLIGALDYPEQELEFETSEEKLSELQRNYLLMNDLAYADLLISCQEDIGFSIIENAESREMPGGDARMAWIELENKFEP